MPRTYLKTTSAGPVRPRKKTPEKKKISSKASEKEWRSAKLYSSDEEEDQLSFKVKTARIPLSTVDNKLNLDRRGGGGGTEDVFDQLFNHVNVDKMKAPRVLKDPISFSSDHNSTLNSDNSDQCFGLFKSFNEGSPLEKVRKPSQRRNNKKVKPNTLVSMDSEKVKDDTLMYELKFANLCSGTSLLDHEEKEVDPGAQDPSMCASVDESRLSVMSATKKPLFSNTVGSVDSPQSFFATLGSRKMTALTSTPLLRTTLSQNLSLSSTKTSSVADETNLVVDDVFTPDPSRLIPSTAGEVIAENNTKSLHVPSSRVSALSSEDMFPATPESKVNRTRGRKPFAGPALSLMQQMQWKMTLHIPSPANSTSSTSSTSGMNASRKVISRSNLQSISRSKLNSSSEISRSNLQSSSDISNDAAKSSVSLHRGSRTESETSVNSVNSANSLELSYEVRISCVCGYDQEIESCLIICDGCNFYLHSNCVGLTDDNLQDIMKDNLDWFCPRCLEGNRPKEDSFSFIASSCGDPETESTEKQEPSVEGKEVEADVNISEIPDMSLLFTKPNEPDAVTDFIVKPGKSWRRSLSVTLAQGHNLSRKSTLGISLKTPSKDVFAVPEPKGLSKRLSSRPSARKTRAAVISETLKEEEEEEEEEVITSVSRTCSIGRQRSSVNGPRPSFYIVSKNKEADRLQVSDASILTEPEVSSLDKLMSVCTGEKVVAFSSYYDEDSLAGSRKVGEGAFGEVYMVGSQEKNKPVLKVVPIGGDIKVNDEEQTTLPDMMSEIVISKGLSDLRLGKKNKTEGFVEVRKCIVFQGVYPPKLLSLWDDFDREKTSENTRPDYLPPEQLYVALEFNNGGKDLEKYEFRHATQALAAWKQVVHALAVAEAELKFEHRDLHWGNVLIKETERKSVDYHLNGSTYSVETCGVETTIIDFSLSRLSSSVDQCIIFNNLAEDPTLFKALGAENGGDYQFDIYRKMQKENKNNWEEFNPKTNIFWLHYMLEKMVTEVYYKGKKASKPHKSGLALLRRLRSNLLEYSSARDYVTKEGNLVLN